MDKKEYHSIHAWLRYHYGRADRCEEIGCKNNGKTFHWSLNKGFEHGKDVTRYKMRCSKCHDRYDMTAEKLERKKANGRANKEKRRAFLSNPEQRKILSQQQKAHYAIYGKKPSQVGSKQWQAKLNEIKVAEIKKSLQLGESTLTISQRYKVSRSSICDIAAGRTWMHVKI